MAKVDQQGRIEGRFALLIAARDRDPAANQIERLTFRRGRLPSDRGWRQGLGKLVDQASGQGRLGLLHGLERPQRIAVRIGGAGGVQPIADLVGPRQADAGEHGTATINEQTIRFMRGAPANALIDISNLPARRQRGAIDARCVPHLEWAAQRQSRKSVTSLPASPDARDFLRSLFRAALGAADPAVRIPPHLPPRPRGRTVVVGGGKAASSMAAAVEAHWQGELSGLVICPHGYGSPSKAIEIAEAAHPVPDGAGERAVRRMLGLLEGLTEDDLVLALISGGGSALMSLPAAGITLADKREVTRALLMCGAPIDEFNCVRKHLSGIKGGRLATAAWPTPVHALIMSDVPGDRSCGDCLGTHCRRPHHPSGAGAGDPLTATSSISRSRSARTRNPVSSRPRSPATAPVEEHADLGFQAGRSIDRGRRGRRAAGADAGPARRHHRGPAGDARAFAGIAIAAARSGMRAAAPCVLISGGETTVTVHGKGKGGRNREFALGLAVALAGRHGISALACDTDGIDGSPDAAGAIVLPDTLARAAAIGLDARAALLNNDAGGFFDALGDQIVTGPTRTNVNDFRAIFIPAGS